MVRIFGYQTDGLLGVELFIASLLLTILAIIILYRYFRLSKYFPLSTFVTIIGFIIGIIIVYTYTGDALPSLSRSLINYLVTPPILFNTGYFLKSNFFFENIVEIFILAFVNTLFNILIIGGIFYALQPLFRLEFRLEDIFLYATCLSSVAPTSVLEVFTQEHVDNSLYILVFGESALNGVVSLTLYEVFFALGEESDQSAVLVPIGIGRFLVYAVGGVLIGILILMALMWGMKQARFVPYLNVIGPYLIGFSSYALAGALYFSPSVAILVSGMLLSRYNELNMKTDVRDAFQTFAKGLGLIMQCVLFMLFGVVSYGVIVQSVKQGHFDWALVIATIIGCLVVRFITICGLIPLINIYRSHHKILKHRKGLITMSERIMLSIAGVRGAMSILLLFNVPSSIPQAVRSSMLSAAAIEIIFSIIIQGGTLQLWVRVFYKGHRSLAIFDNNRKIRHKHTLPHFHPHLVEKQHEFDEDEMSLIIAQRVISQPLEILVNGADAIRGVGGFSNTRFHEAVGLIDKIFYNSIVRPKKKKNRTEKDKCDGIN